MDRVDFTISEAIQILQPAMTYVQLAVLIAIAGIEQTGVRHTGHPGRPPATYDSGAIMRAHADETARTSKRFIDHDWIAAALLARSIIHADPAAGTLRWADGTRAETMRHDHYGYVRIGGSSVAAHRTIWIAADGEIPPGIQINHINQLRWDNRRANLELVTFGNNIRHAHGGYYLTVPDAQRQLAALPPAPEMPSPAESLMRAGGAFRHL